MERYEKPVMEVELFSEEEQEIFTDGDPLSGDNLEGAEIDSLSTHKTC